MRQQSDALSKALEKLIEERGKTVGTLQSSTAASPSASKEEGASTDGSAVSSRSVPAGYPDSAALLEVSVGRTRALSRKNQAFVSQVKTDGFTQDSTPRFLMLLSLMAQAYDEDRKNLTQLREKLSHDINSYHSSLTSRLSKRIDDQKKSIEAECASRVAKANSAIKWQQQRVEKAKSDITATTQKFNNALMMTQERRQYKKELAALEAELPQIEESSAALIQQEQDGIQALYRDRDAKLKSIEEGRGRIVAKADDEYHVALSACRYAYDQALRQLDSEYVAWCEQVVDSSTIRALNARAAFASGRPFDSFPFYKDDDGKKNRFENWKQPGEFYLGILRTPRTSIDGGWGRLLSAITDSPKSFRYRGEDDRFDAAPRLQLKYCVDLAAGLRLTITPKSQSDDGLGDTIKLLTIRLLMAYQPTKLQLTLVDPMRNGDSFAGIKQVVDREHESVINGEVFTEGGNIAGAIKSLKRRYQSFNENYANSDPAEFFMREAVQGVVINDFPNKFTPEALSDLVTVIESGKKFGGVVVIGINPSYVGDLTKNPDYRKIVQGDAGMMKVSQLPDGSMTLALSGEHSGLFGFAFGDIDEVRGALGTVLDRLREAISTASSRVERFDALHDNLNDSVQWWQKDSRDGLRIPIGIAGTQGPVFVTVGRSGADVRHHGVVAGTTGAGKSTVLHTMIMSTLIDYSAREAQLVLIDFKNGTEFKQYAEFDIPSFRSITTATEPEFALAALKDIMQEVEHRRDLGMSDYAEWRRAHEDEIMSRIIIIFDEVHMLFAPSVPAGIKSECSEILHELTSEGRSFGVHVFLASQSFGNISEVQSELHNMSIRIGMKDADISGIIEDSSLLSDAPKGSAILNEKAGKADGGSQLVQIARIGESERNRILMRLQDLYAPERTTVYGALRTHVHFSNIADNPQHPICVFRKNGFVETWKGETPRLHVGSILSETGRSNAYENAGTEHTIDFGFENLLLVGNNIDMANRLFVLFAASACLDACGRIDGNRRARDKIVAFDFNESTLAEDVHRAGTGPLSYQDIYSLPLVEHVPMATASARRGRGARGAASLQTLFTKKLDELHAELNSRQEIYAREGDEVVFDDIILFFNGFENIGVHLQKTQIEAMGGYGETQLGKLCDILRDGPTVDIYSIVWSQNARAVDRVLEKDISGVGCHSFSKRIVFSASPEEFESLANMHEPLSAKTAVAYYDQKNNARMSLCPHDVPTRQWFGEFCDRYSEVRAAAEGFGLL